MALSERNRLVMEQLPQVRCIAQKIHARLPHHIQLEDLVNTGILGLIEALAKFDPRRNVQLQSYARYRIQGAILDSLREQDWGSRLLRQKERQLEGTRNRLRARLGRSPSQAEIATEMGISDPQLQHLLCDLQGLDVSSLQAPGSQEGRSTGERMADAAEKSPFSLCEHAEMSSLLKQAMHKLPLRKRQVLELYYFKGLTMKEAGDQLGICESRISQIHTEAVAKLKELMSEVLHSQEQEDFCTPSPRATTTVPGHVAFQAKQDNAAKSLPPQKWGNGIVKRQRSYSAVRRYKKEAFGSFKSPHNRA